jgi:hypothetical protein
VDEALEKLRRAAEVESPALVRYLVALSRAGKLEAPAVTPFDVLDALADMLEDNRPWWGFLENNGFSEAEQARYRELRQRIIRLLTPPPTPGVPGPMVDPDTLAALARTLRDEQPMSDDRVPASGHVEHDLDVAVTRARERAAVVGEPGIMRHPEPPTEGMFMSPVERALAFTGPGPSPPALERCPICGTSPPCPMDCR